jgi:hypothetical protein
VTTAVDVAVVIRRLRTAARYHDGMAVEYAARDREDARLATRAHEQCAAELRRAADDLDGEPMQ